MGMLSSWAVFSLSHHIIVQMLFKAKGEKPLYWIVGDDIVIGSSSVAEAYVQMMETLGIEIS